ncbi:MAG: PAS domain-containing protein [Chloroflexi bacterium]|nr:MAG: PAS domain-containing protein [Chloroflexota bacterium]
MKSVRGRGDRSGFRRRWLDEDRMLHVLDELPVAMSIIDGKGRIVLCNSATSMIGGASTGTDLQRMMRGANAHHPDGRPFAADDVPTARALRGEVVRGELVALKRDGATERTLHLSAVPLRDTSGTIVGAVLVSIDASELRATDDQLRLMAMLVHELRTPLTTAWGHVQMAKRTLERSGPTSVLAKSLQIAEIQLRRLGRLLQEMQTSIDARAPLFDVTPEPTDLVALVRGVTSRHGQRHVLEFRAPIETLVASVDADRIDEIVENLVANAELYTVPGGAILVTLAQAKPAGDIELQVKDSGIGVPDADRSHLFEPSFRGSNVGERGGTGLGLYISRLIAQRHGGDLRLESTSSTGATFTLVLPGRGHI